MMGMGIGGFKDLRKDPEKFLSLNMFTESRDEL